MRVQSIAIISALAAASLADAAAANEYQRVWTSQNNGTNRPTVFVSLGDLDAQTQLFLPEMKLEWTANGQPMPPSMAGVADCITASAQAYSCEALNQWFKDPLASGGRPGRDWSRSGYPEGFQLRNMEFDTDYCFRFQIGYQVGAGQWGTWRCARTPSPPPPPPRPFAPSKPVLTLLPAESGAGKIGGDVPLRILVEWQPNPANNGIAPESVLIFGNGDWQPTGGESRPGEKIVMLSQDADPEGVYTLRICAKNVSGEACSPLTRTPGRPWLEKVPAGGKASRFPAPQGSDTYNPDTPTAIPADPVLRAQGRVELPQSAGPSPLSQLSICEKAQVARARNSPAAPGLEAQCAAQASLGIPALAEKGEAMASADPSAAELRRQQPGEAARRGFDIGLAAAGEDTEPGPGKQRIHDSLAASEQGGFAAAMSFSLARNKHGEAAATGAAIAEANPDVAAARATEASVLFQQGFDISTAIFGYPELGARGNTLKGPGSLAVRASLSDAGKRGFDAAADYFKIPK